MLRQIFVVLVALAVARAEYFTTKTADKDFLLKQKKIYNLLFHVSQPELINPQLYEEGNSYNIEANIDSYTDVAVVKDFLHVYNHGMLPRGELFSLFYPETLQQAELVFKLFYYAKDFDVFYKTALWARIHVNEGQFVYALYNAVIRRPDTMYVQLPPPYEIYPYAFYNSEVLEKAHHAKIFGKLDAKKPMGYESYIIPANYSGWYVNYEYDTESKLNYFVEDIGLNAYYFFFRLQYPFWMSSEEFQFPKYRGSEYLYGHKQIMARYFLERLSNDLGKIEDFDWSREFYAGYYPTMTYHNGLPYPQRPHWNRFPHYKFKYIQDIREMESRVASAIDSGIVMSADRQLKSIYTPEGLNILGNMIEGNLDSCNIEFYGSIDKFGRKILGFNLDPASPYQIYPSALESYLTSMRDPAFYRLYKKIFYYYYRYKLHEKPYKMEEVVYPSLKVDSFVVDKLITYFDQFDSTISNGLMVHSQPEAENMLIKVRQYRLNHKPFSYHLTVNADKQIKAAVRVFIGPKYDVHHKQMDIFDSLKYFYEIDNFVTDLNAGPNKIVRKSEEFFFVMQDPEPSEMFYKRLVKALEGTETLSYNERVYGFPERLLLPKGKKEGMPLQFFVHVSPVEQQQTDYVSRIFGNYKFDQRNMGYPLDRPFQHYDYNGPNMVMKDVFVYHKDDSINY